MDLVISERPSMTSTGIQRDDGSTFTDEYLYEAKVQKAITTLKHPVSLHTVDVYRKQNRTALLYWKSSCRISAMRMAYDRRRYLSSLQSGKTPSPRIRRSVVTSHTIPRVKRMSVEEQLPFFRAASQELEASAATVAPPPEDTTVDATTPVEEQGLTPTVSIVQHTTLPKSAIDLPPRVMPSCEATAAATTASSNKPCYSSSDDGFYVSSVPSSPVNTLERVTNQDQNEKQKESLKDGDVIITEIEIEDIEDLTPMMTNHVPSGLSNHIHPLNDDDDDDENRDADDESEGNSSSDYDPHRQNNLQEIMSTPLRELNKTQPQFEVPVKVTPVPDPDTSPNTPQLNGVEDRGHNKDEGSGTTEPKKKGNWIKRAFRRLKGRKKPKKNRSNQVVEN